MADQIFIVYCSPAGSTRHVAEVIEHALSDPIIKTHKLDIAKKENSHKLVNHLANSGNGDLLLIGSPVYRDVAVPPIMDFIQSLPKVNGCSALPFVTWGGAFSGIALWQMGQALVEKGFLITGGAKILAVHSMMWSLQNAAGSGHPDNKDDEMISNFVSKIYHQVSTGKVQELPLQALDYNPQQHTEEIKKKISQPWKIIPKTVKEDKCTQCGTCEEVCPVKAIVFRTVLPSQEGDEGYTVNLRGEAWGDLGFPTD